MLDILTEIDFFILSLIQNHVVRESLTTPMKVFTYVGNAGMIWIIIGIILLINKRTRRVGIVFLIFLAIEHYGINDTIKHAVSRPRPFIQDTTVPLMIKAPASTSFPSGHSSSSFFSATFLYRYRKYLGVPAFILAILIAFSRMYFYVHFPSDVLAGAFEGILVGLVGSLVLHIILTRPVTTKIKKTKEAHIAKKEARAAAKASEDDL